MLETNFTPFPEIKTQRLLLRKMVEADAEKLQFLRSDDSVMKYIEKERTKTIEEALEFIIRINADVDANLTLFWAIALAEQPTTMIGTICIWNIKKQHYRAEIGYVLHPNFWRTGLTNEAIQATVKFGFKEMKLHSIEAHINPNNIASASILEKNGFIREAYFKEDYCYNGRFLDTAIYSLLNT